MRKAMRRWKNRIVKPKPIDDGMDQISDINCTSELSTGHENLSLGDSSAQLGKSGNDFGNPDNIPSNDPEYNFINALIINRVLGPNDK